MILTTRLCSTTQMETSYWEALNTIVVSTMGYSDQQKTKMVLSDGSAVKGTGCSCRWPGFISLNLQGGSHMQKQGTRDTEHSSGLRAHSKHAVIETHALTQVKW